MLPRQGQRQRRLEERRDAFAQHVLRHLQRSRVEPNQAARRPRSPADRLRPGSCFDRPLPRRLGTAAPCPLTAGTCSSIGCASIVEQIAGVHPGACRCPATAPFATSAAAEPRYAWRDGRRRRRYAGLPHRPAAGLRADRRRAGKLCRLAARPAAEARGRARAAAHRRAEAPPGRARGRHRHRRRHARPAAVRRCRHAAQGGVAVRLGPAGRHRLQRHRRGQAHRLRPLGRRRAPAHVRPLALLVARRRRPTPAMPPSAATWTWSSPGPAPIRSSAS